MTAPFRHRGRNPFDNPLDRILAEIAFSVQLPPSLHAKAAERYEAVCRYLEAHPEFAGNIEHFYPQGSMAIDATISNRGTDGEYDLDAVSQLGGPFRDMRPLAILLALENALAGYPVDKVVRQTRCVTLYYSDGMHLDVTPALRDYGTRDRQSQIAHAKGPRPSPEDRLVEMNAYGFNAWYIERTPEETAVSSAFRDRWAQFDANSVRADADVDDVPEQAEFVVKNTATLALQLIKRFRNIMYADYQGRIPPSVVLAYYAGLAAHPDMSLSDMLIRLAKWIIGDIEDASLRNRKLHVENPRHAADVFTDRWPESVPQQDQFAAHLRALVQGLETAQKGDVLPDRLMDWLRQHFGARVVTKAADRMAVEVGATVQSAEHSYGRRGGLVAPAAGAAAIVGPPKSSPVPASRHTFYGRKIR